MASRTGEKMTSKAYIAVVVALLLGLVLGRLAPQADIRTLRKQIAELKLNPASRRGVGGAAAIQGVQSILNVADAGAASRACGSASRSRRTRTGSRPTRSGCAR